MQWVASVGEATGNTVAYVGALAEISAKSLRLLFLSPLKRSRMLQRAIHEAMGAGVGAIPIISLITLFVGVIIALQGAYELQRLGAMQLVASLVAIAIAQGTGAAHHRHRGDWKVRLGLRGGDWDHAGHRGTGRAGNHGAGSGRVSGGAQIPGDGPDAALPGDLGGPDGYFGRRPVWSGRRRLHIWRLPAGDARRPAPAGTSPAAWSRAWCSDW